MGPTAPLEENAGAWIPIADPEGRFSTGTADLDRRLGGGFARGSVALFHTDETVTPEDRDLVFFPTILNFLYQSRGMIAVLPARDSPHGFRARLTRYATRRRFDTRVRIVDYVGEDDDAPYVVSLRPLRAGKPNMEKMEAAEKAAQGDRKRCFLEMNAFEVIEMLVGPEDAAKMFFHGIKRARMVGNLVLGILRPGLGCADAVRGMADVELALHRDGDGLHVRGLRPAFPDHLVLADPERGLPHVRLAPTR